MAFALEEIDFAAEPGQLVALVGPSGSSSMITMRCRTREL